MQVPQADTSQSKRVGVDEKYINFKSSPNFKGMKKFIRLKIDNTETSQPNKSPDHLSQESEEGNILPSAAGDAATKMEGESKDFAPEGGTPAALDQPEAANFGSPSDTESDSKPKEPIIMCRDFVRGTCKRPGPCRYAHVLVPAQLEGVYTFCKNFQNKECTLPHCKYVHATIFEEQEFYRTAKLPAHVLAPKTLRPPPPPPPPATFPPPGPRLDIPTSFANPPPPILPPPSMPPPILPPPALPPPALPPPRKLRPPMMPPPPGAGVPGAVVVPILPSTPESLSPRTFMLNEFRTLEGEPARKVCCKNCDINKFSEEYHRRRVEERRKSVNEWKRKVTEAEDRLEKYSALVAHFLSITRDRP